MSETASSASGDWLATRPREIWPRSWGAADRRFPPPPSRPRAPPRTRSPSVQRRFRTRPIYAGLQRAATAPQTHCGPSTLQHHDVLTRPAPSPSAGLV